MVSSLMQRLGPEAMRQHRDARRLRPIVGRIDQAAADGLQSHHREKRSTDHAGTDDARLAQADQREVDAREIAQGGNRFDAGLEIVDLGHRKIRVLAAGAWRALPDVDQPLLVVVDERREQHAADNAEDCGVGADAKGQREDDGEGQAAGPGQ